MRISEKEGITLTAILVFIVGKIIGDVVIQLLALIAVGLAQKLD